MFLAWLLAALVAAPLAAVALHLLLPRVDVWRHLADTILWELTWNTAWLLVAVALGADTRHRPRLARGHPPLSGTTVLRVGVDAAAGGSCVYPYLMARSAFATLGPAPVEAARGLGLGPRQPFWRVALPLARPAIAVGVALALMEALADFGTVSLFDYELSATSSSAPRWRERSHRDRTWCCSTSRCSNLDAALRRTMRGELR